MFEEFNICPYPGLRSFTEEESLYFKGREGQVEEVIELLGRNQFLMITGASGDGKSSLVYAGLIPNARAGFFKSRYSNWVVADFRPERSPIKNLAESLTANLELPALETVETEISRGYSSIIDLYTNSKFYSEDSANDLQHGNLLILVDQFEELFTNPENYFEGVPSNEAQTTVNLLLETAKIAKEKNLPIYVVCTMRSDFIGQCAAFRGLPEYIGFSQFFVPRLKRNEIQQIIEEPAELSGNRITRRLVERLIYDLTEGIDQLPILQHALSQIWIAADSGNEEMDLLHYAMVGGMAVEELPQEDQEKYHQWFASIPETQQRSYDYSSLENVLDIHANKLYESAAEVYNASNPDQITIREAKNVLAITFACLTKIDQSRAVRNRMTLGEITNIINRPGFDFKKVGRIINIFRKEGNTFIRPFLMEGDELDLSENTVLDITHESLIRNWKRLLKWVNKEFSFYEDYTDFKKQLDRWVDSGKSSNFLLPLGPLSYFESWYFECNPNKYWIARYSDSQSDLHSSQKILDNTNEYLKRSDRKHIISRTFMRYGARRIAVIFALVLSFVLSGFYYVDALSKQNQQIIDTIYEKSEQYLNNTDNIPAFNRAKSEYMLSVLRLDPDKAYEMLENIQDNKLKVEIPGRVYSDLIFYNRKFDGEEKEFLITLTIKNLSEAIKNQSNDDLLILKNLNSFITAINYDRYYNDKNLLRDVSTAAHEQLQILLLRILKGDLREDFGTESEISVALRHFLNNGTDEQIIEALHILSPFEDGKEVFDFYFRKSSVTPNGRTGLTHNGGYQLLSEAYARTRNLDYLTQCIDSVARNNDIGAYLNYQSLNNHITVMSYLTKFGGASEFDDILTKYQQYGLSLPVFFHDFFDQVGYMKFYYITNVGHRLQTHPGVINPIAYFINPNTLAHAENRYFEYLEATGNQQEINYRKAIYYKNKALIAYRYFTDRGTKINNQVFEDQFDRAFQYYDMVSDDYLNERALAIYHYYSDGFREAQLPRRQVFLYPDLLAGWHSYRYSSPVFVQYLLDNNKLEEYYNGPSIDLFPDWVSIQFEKALNEDNDLEMSRFFEVFDQDYEVLIALENRLSEIPGTDMNYLRALLANYHFESLETEKALEYAKGLDISTLNESKNRQEYLNQNEFLNEIFRLVVNLGQYDFNTTSKLLNTLGGPQYKTLGFIGIAKEVYQKNNPQESFIYLDSALSLIQTYNPPDYQEGFVVYLEMLKVLDLIGGDDINRLSDQYLGRVYPFGLNSKILGNVESRNYYKAYQLMPESNTQVQELYTFSSILLYEALMENNDERWSDHTKLIIQLAFSNRLVFI